MSLLLPQNPEIRKLFDVADLAAKRWVTLTEARFSARRQKWDGVKSIFYLVLRANGDVHLMRFGPRGGKSTVWNFGYAPG